MQSAAMRTAGAAAAASKSAAASAATASDAAVAAATALVASATTTSTGATAEAVQSFLHDELHRVTDRMLINGEFVPAHSGKTLPVINPATEQVVARVAEADGDDVDRAVRAARAAFARFRETDGAHRRDYMIKLAELVHTHRDALAALESVNSGKPFAIARDVDVAQTEQCFRFYAGFADKVYGEVAPTSGHSMALVKRQPVGVCGQIIPWNFPLLMAAWKLAPALALGNAVLLKPSEQTPLTALVLGSLACQAGYPAGVVNVLPGFGASAGAAIARHADVDKLAFTGSTRVGREVLQMSSSSNLKRVSLELGGKSPLIVCADADLADAVSIAVKGLCFNTGQVCTAATRMYVHTSLYDAFVTQLAARLATLRVGAGPSSTGYDMGPLISQTQLTRVLDYIDLGKREGARVVTGGGRYGTCGYFVQPTLFVDVADTMRVCREEIFGPVGCILPFRELDEAIVRANDSTYGLAAGICTRDMDTALRYSSYLDAGTVWINDWNTFECGMPFGGFKQSGIGRELSQQALELYTQAKSIYFRLGGPIVKP